MLDPETLLKTQFYSEQVEFEGVGKAGYSGDVAIDDIEWNPRCKAKKLCHDEQFSCRDPKCIPSFLNCNFYNDCPSGSDEHYCGESSILALF